MAIQKVVVTPKSHVQSHAAIPTPTTPIHPQIMSSAAPPV
jgi:hypothetical protein